MASRTIESPGVQITEIDISPTAALPTGTNVLLAGFAPKGPTDEVLQITSRSEFEQVYGTPSTPAERYFYHSVTPLFNTNANVQVYRMPYGTGNGAGFGSNYGALVYPVTAVDISQDRGQFGKALTTYNAYASGVLYLVGKPTHFELTQDQYTAVAEKQPGAFSWSATPKTSFASTSDMGAAGIVVLNSSQTTINNTFEGFYIGLADNSSLTPASNYTTVLNVQTVAQSAAYTTNYITLPGTRLNFSLSSTTDSVLNGQLSECVSQVMENLSQFNINDRAYDDTLSLGLFRLRQSVFAPDTIKLDYVLTEKYVASVDYYRQVNSQNGGAPVSFFLETAEDQSPNLNIVVNDYISHKNGSTWLDIAGNPSNKIRMITSDFAVPGTLLTNLSAAFGCINPTQVSQLGAQLLKAYNFIGAADNLYSLGAFETANPQLKDLGSIPAKLDRMFDIVEDTALYDIDLTVDGGLSTIFAVSQWLDTNAPATVKYFDDNVYVTAIEGLAVTDVTAMPADATTFKENWSTIFQRFAQFAGAKRKDHVFIADLPRNIFIQGANSLTLKNLDNNFSQNIYNPIRNVLAEANTSYAITYANWAKVFDTNLDDQTWIPFSGTIAATIATSDTNNYVWSAPAGFTRGVVGGINNVALFPKQKQRDQLYKISVNPIAFVPGDGIIIYGQKTLLKRPSSFDRLNVRRLFLYLEKATGRAAKYYIFEPNTLLTRTRVVNELTPIFDYAKNTEGVYDYRVICDERNNTPSVIDANELVVDIYIKAVRTAEYILVNFYSTRTGTDFNELIG